MTPVARSRPGLTDAAPARPATLRRLRRGIGSLFAASAILLVACGGGGGGSSGSLGGGGGPASLPSGSNVAPITVDSGPAGTVNTPFVSVTLCEPGTANCQSIDHVLVDSGSSGLRIISSKLTLSLPAARDSGGNAIAECGQFADGSTFGAVRTADVKIAGEQASSLPVHVIGDPAMPTIPADCLATGPPQNSVQSFGANGVLGVAVFREDCGGACASAVVPATYYSCPASGCVPVAMPLAGQVQNPVAKFQANNNGVAIVLLPVDPAGAALVAGALVFGIGTQTNNAPGRANVLPLDPNFGTLTTRYNGQTLRNSFVDSGSNGLFFADSSLPECTGNLAPGFYCPLTSQNYSAMLQGTNGTAVNVSFNVANANALLNGNATFIAFGNLAGTNPLASSFDWGLPFFYGRTVFFAIEGRSTPAGTGPYLAF